MRSGRKTKLSKDTMRRSSSLSSREEGIQDTIE